MTGDISSFAALINSSHVVFIQTDSEPAGSYTQKRCAIISINAKDMPRSDFKVILKNALISHNIFCGWMKFLLRMES